MTLFRKKGIMYFLTALMSVVFLNLSFFHAELSASNLKSENKALYDYLLNTFSSICEEEKDSAGGETAEGENITKELDILKSTFDSVEQGFLIMLIKNFQITDGHISDGLILTLLQPPEVLG